MLMTALLAASVAFGPAEMSDIQTSTKDVQNLWEEADENCRGGYPQDVKMYAACASRDVYQALLQNRGVCRDGPSGAEMSWQKCRKARRK